MSFNSVFKCNRMPENDEINSKKEFLAIEHIFGNPPGWILNWGISSILFFIIVCIIISGFVSYPDKLFMHATIQSIQPPILSISKSEGEIEKINFKDKKKVKKEEILMEVRSTLKIEDLNKLEIFFEKYYSIKFIPEYLKINVPKGLELGNINANYAQIVQLFEDFQNTLKQNTVFIKTASLENEIKQINKLNESLIKQENFYQKELNLSIKDFKRNLDLNRNGAISDVEKEKVESKLLLENRNVENFKSNRINNEVKIQQIKTEISSLKSNRAVDISVKKLQINQIIDKIKGDITEWKNLFQVKAVVDGTISLSKQLNVNQFIKTGDTLFSIIPENQNVSIIAFGYLPQKASGILRIGQKATLNIQDFPSNQYGLIIGEVADISLVPQGNNYLVKLKLTNGLKTTYNVNLPFKQNLLADVSIQTKTYSILERLFQNILDIIKNKSK